MFESKEELMSDQTKRPTVANDNQDQKNGELAKPKEQPKNVVKPQIIGQRVENRVAGGWGNYGDI